MIRVERKINKKAIISLILLVAFVILLTASILLNVLGGKESGGSPSKKPPLEILAGESTYGSYNVAYPFIEDSALMQIGVSDKLRSFKLTRPGEDGDMMLYYTDENGHEDLYFPNIFASDENIAYSSIYAAVGGDGLGMVPMVSYLCSAVGFTAFQDRIPLSEDESTRTAQLVTFGFTENEYVTIDVAYTVPAENEGDEPRLERHSIKIGKKMVSGSGRYFMVDGRDYIYCSAFDYFEYGLQGYLAFVKPYIVTEGMAGDESILAAYLTREFTQWKNTIHDTPGDVVEAGSRVVINAETLVPSYDKYGGYASDGFKKTTIFLEGLDKDPAYSRLLATLVGSKVGVYYDYMTPGADPNDALIFTLASQSKLIDFSKKDSTEYRYTILYIESVLSDTEEKNAIGTPVGDCDLVKVGYTLSIDGTPIATQNNSIHHAIIDLKDERIPADVRETLAAGSVGDLAKALTFSVNYTKDTAEKYEMQYVICDILEIYDKDGRPIDKVAADSSVVYRYYLVADGVRNEEIHVGSVSFAEPDKDNEETAHLREALMGKEIAHDIELLVMSYTDYSELLYDFVTYKVAEIEYFVTSELITSFGFTNASDRDPFVAESFYSYTDKMTGKNKLYGIDVDSCVNVVKYFMGVTDESASMSDGLLGDETVAIGLTPEHMEKYGLYAYTIFIELPRGIYPIEDENYNDEDALDNFDCRDTLSFYLYISEKQYDGSRYVASDMYDLVAKVDGDMFDFLDYDFADFWARRTLLLVDVHQIENMKFEFNMDDLYGSYNLDLTHETVYVDEEGNTYLAEPEDIYTDRYNLSHIDVTQFGKCVETEFSKFLAAKGLDTTSLTVLFNNVRGDGSMIMGNRDTLGSASYKNYMNLVYGIYYTDIIDDLTEAERDEIKSGEPMMSMSLLLDSKAYYYTYDFHRLDDRRIMVTLYESDGEGNQLSEEVSDFYISTFAFKKIVRGFFGVLNAEDIDPEIGYPKED